MHIGKEITKARGIEEINLERLGQVVALIGRNGSGKSRILKLVEEFIKRATVLDLTDGTLEFVPLYLNNQFNNTSRFLKERHLLQLNLNRLNSFKVKDEKNIQEIQNLQQRIGAIGNMPEIQNLRRNPQPEQHFNQQIQKIQSKIQGYFLKIDHKQIQELKQTIDNANLTATTFEALMEKVSEEQDYQELASINQTALSYLSKLPHILVKDKDDAYGDAIKYEAKKAHQQYMSLKKLIKDFLNKDLRWEKQVGQSAVSETGVTTQSKGAWLLADRPFNYSEFSDGEKTLFAYSLLFFLLEQNPAVRISESIIVIDEPELHLHPESEIAVIKGIRKVIAEKGQLWIATHSINILADLSYDEIFMVKNNSIIPPGRVVPGQTLVELMGLDGQIEKLTTFVTNISNWAFLNFMTQCFNDPDTIEAATANDPEVNLFKKAIKENENGTMLLDFGAGKGRIYKEINSSDLKAGLKYHALEPNPVNIEELQRAGIEYSYKDYTELPTNYFDFILLCGVLHEIPATTWPEILNKIKDSLKENGFIILIEDLSLPKGEKIEDDGFLILDTESAQKLFGMKEKPSTLISSEARYKDRILCALLNKSKLNNVTVQTTIEAIQQIKKNAFQKIKTLRKETPTPQNKLSLGREAALNSQLYLNSDLALEKLSALNNNKPVDPVLN